MINCKPQTGFSLISAIFLLVVIAALGTFAVTLSTAQHQSQILDIMGARGYQAALAGIEWASYNVNQQPVNSQVAWAGCTTPGAAVAAGVGSGLESYTITVSCSATSAVEGANTIWLYDVSSVAETGTPGDVNYVKQIATAKLAK